MPNFVMAEMRVEIRLLDAEDERTKQVTKATRDQQQDLGAKPTIGFIGTDHAEQNEDHGTRKSGRRYGNPAKARNRDDAGKYGK